MKLCYLPIFMLFCLPCQISAIGISVNGNETSYQIDANVGEDISLNCQVDGNVKNETLIWYRGEDQVDLKPDNRINSSCVRIFPVSHEDHQISFTCILKSNDSMQVSAYLNVRFPPILEKKEDVTVEVEKTAKLYCHFKANPQAEMSWKKNGSSVPIAPRFEQHLGGDIFQLTIKKVEKTDAGIYTCLARTPVDDVTEQIIVVVEDKKDVLPIEAIAAAVVVGALIILFGLFARRDQLFKSCLDRLNFQDCLNYLKERNTSL